MRPFAVCSLVFGIPLATLLWWQGATPLSSVIAAGLGTFALDLMIKQHKFIKNS